MPGQENLLRAEKLFGEMIAKEAYAQSKMTHGMSWTPIFSCEKPIYPSDPDLKMHNFLNNKDVLIELSRHTVLWQDLKKGQKSGYEVHVIKGRGANLSALARHNVPVKKQIDSAKDILNFNFYYYKNGVVLDTGPIKNTAWVADDIGNLWTAHLIKFLEFDNSEYLSNYTGWQEAFGSYPWPNWVTAKPEVCYSMKEIADKMGISEEKARDLMTFGLD